MKKIVFIFALVLTCFTSTIASNSSPKNNIAKKVFCVQTFTGMQGSVTVDNGPGGNCTEAWLAAANIYFKLTAQN
jgi:hypothetical protein